jgi:hypothetical protein
MTDRLDDLQAVVAEFGGNGLALVAVDDLAPRPVAIDQDRHQDAVNGEVVPEGDELIVDRLAGLLLVARTGKLPVGLASSPLSAHC